MCYMLNIKKLVKYEAGKLKIDLPPDLASPLISLVKSKYPYQMTNERRENADWTSIGAL